MIGQTISHYKILEELGAGGMGVVYKAEDTKLKRTVALKFLSPQSLGSKEERSRFIHEAQAAAALDHSNICTIHEINEADGKSFIAMAYVDGPSLKEEVESGPLDVDRALGIAIQVADGLRVAHGKGIVHRDIKSANIMLTSEGQAKITDFGLAKLPGRTKLTKTGSTVGTLAYMSPEQAQGSEVDHRSDVWSLGVVLYELLSGKVPFKGDHEAAMVYSIMNQDVAALRDRRADVPAELDSIIAKMLQKNPCDRYESAKELLSDLRKVQAGAAVKVALPMSRKAKRMAWGLSAVVVIAAVISSLVIFNRGPSPVVARTLAVVDFDIISGEDTPYLAEGLADGISAKLSKLQGIRVASSDDIRRLRKKDLSAREVASQLGAQFALGGSLLKSGKRIRVTPQLIEASTGTVIWSEPLDREFGDLLEFLDEVSLKIVDVLEIELNPTEKVALEERPTESPEAYEHYLKGRHFYYRVTLKDNELSAKEFQKALQADAEYPLALAGLADSYVQRYKEGYDYDEHWLDEAKRLSDRALGLDPDLAEAHESRAEVFLEEENYPAALEEAERASALRPDLDEPYLRLGEVHNNRGEYQQAMERFEQALSIRPSVEALCGKGDVLLRRGEIDEARGMFEMAAKLNPGHDRPYRSLAGLHNEELQDPKLAEDFFRKAIEVRPDRGLNYWAFSEFLSTDERFEEAEDLLRGFLDKYPYHWGAYEALYEFLAWSKGDYTAAMEIVEESVTRNPDRVWPHLFLSGSYAWGFGHGPEPAKAMEALDRALAMRPNSVRVLHWAGAIFKDLGRTDEAIEYYERVLALNPGYRPVLQSMSRLYESLGKFEEAADYGLRTVRQAPGDSEYYRFLVHGLIPLGRAEEFQTILKEAADKYGEYDPSFFTYLCREQRLMGEYEESISTARRALAKKDDERAKFDLGISQWFSGDTEAALATLRSTAGYYPAAYHIVSILKAGGRHEEIEEYLGSLRTQAPGKISGPAYWAGVASWYYASMRRFDDALAVISEAREQGTVTYEHHHKFDLAVWYRKRGSIDKAKMLLEECLATCPSDIHPPIYMELAVLRAIRGDFDMAVEYGEQATNLEQNALYFRRDDVFDLSARLYYASGQKDKALEKVRKIRGFVWRTVEPALYRKIQLQTVLSPGEIEKPWEMLVMRATRAARGEDAWGDWSATSVIRALGLARLGDKDEATSAIERGLRLEPERADIAYYAAAAYSLNGDTPLALQWLETAVERGHQDLWWARVDPDLDSLRKLPRFKEILDDWDHRLRAMIN